MTTPDPALNRISAQNPWIMGARQASQAPPVWLVLAAGFLAAAGVGVLSQALGDVVPEAVGQAAPGRAGELLGVTLLYLAVFAPLWLTAGAGAWLERRTIWRSEPRPALAALGGAGLALATFAIALGLAATAGAVHLGPAGGGATAGAALGLIAFVYQAGAEEVLFRGWMQPVLCARLGPWPGLLVTALAFGVLHLVGSAHAPLAILNMVLGGLMFGLLALRSGGLWAAFCAHAAWNWTESCALGLDPNPGVGAFGALTDLELAGSPLWSGGADALNGSLALTVALVLAVGLLAGLPALPEKSAPGSA
jgi:membrane protease YdiL (CAAX protease family)